MRPAAILYALAGSPPQDGCVELDAPEPCRLCACTTTRAIAYERWQGATFTDQNKLRCVAARVVCEACVWACAWNPPPGVVNPPGKKGLNLRLFSHLYDARGYVYANKADKAAIRAWLSAPKSPPWFAAIADSGQKHIIPWAALNLDPFVGYVRFEERDVPADCRLLAEAVDVTCALLTAGATKAEIETGGYRPETWMRCEAQLREYEARFGAERGGGFFELVLWLSQRDEEQVAARMAAEKEAKRGRGKAGQGDRSRRRSAARGAQGVPRERGERAEALAADPRPSAARDEDERADGRVADDAAPEPRPGQSEQLDLFGDGRPRHGGRRR